MSLDIETHSASHLKICMTMWVSNSAWIYVYSKIFCALVCDCALFMCDCRLNSNNNDYITTVVLATHEITLNEMWKCLLRFVIFCRVWESRFGGKCSLFPSLPKWQEGGFIATNYTSVLGKSNLAPIHWAFSHHGFKSPLIIRFHTYHVLYYQAKRFSLMHTSKWLDILTF